MWNFPLKNYTYSLPEGDHPGSFLKERKHHFHEGIDLYAQHNEKVYSVEKGVVTHVFQFTGEDVNSPWWKDTQAIVVKGKSGSVLYGEIKSKVKVGDEIKKGQYIANVKTVLKKKTQNPSSMLHIELYDDFFECADLTKDKNVKEVINKLTLKNPYPYLKKALEKKEKVLLMVSGSISAYKSPDIARALERSGKKVKVILSKGALHFIKPDVFKYLNIACYTTEDDFTSKGVLHIELARWADTVFLCPCSANTLADIACGKADSLLSSVFLSLEKRVKKVILPLMNTQMLHQKITKKNIQSIKNNYNAIFMESDKGLLACGEFGEGKLPETKNLIYNFNLITAKRVKKKVLITAGATIAPIDTIRYVTNPAKGATGLLLAEIFLKEGFDVTVIRNKNALEQFKQIRHPRYKEIVVQTTYDLLEVVKKQSFDVYISTMAVSDIAFEQKSQKLKKKDLNSLETKQAPDVLAWTLKNKKTKHNFIVGFAAETELSESVIEEKLKRKPVDLLVANEADGGFSGNHKGFGTNRGKYILISSRGKEHYEVDKQTIASKIYSQIKERFL